MEISNAGGVTDDSTIGSDKAGGSTTHDADNDMTDVTAEPVDSLSPPSSPFQEGEKVLAFHSQQLYEAKVQKAVYQIRKWRYFVHYLGWNKNWDEWVGMARLMKHTEENVQKQQELKKKQGTDKNGKAARGSQMKTKGCTDMGSSNAAAAAAGVTKDSTIGSDEAGGSTTHDTDIDMADIKAEPVDSPSPPSSPFQEGEKVLAFHSQQLYEAKVQKAVYQTRKWRYFIHYLGWNKTWDEWVGIDRLMKHTEENVQKQQELKEKLGTEKNGKAARRSQMKTKGSTGGRGRKRKTDIPKKDKDGPPPEKLVNIQIPSQLKKQLIDDSEFVNHLGKLVRLPRSPNVDEILEKYHDCQLKKDGVISDSVGEVLSGLQCYFNKALPAMLLYKNEREQFQESIREDVSPSSVYGAEHLLRLFVKLPEILFYASIEDETLADLKLKLQDFLRFLQKNESAFFLSTYHSADSSGVADMELEN